jgi:hypothetical protein
MGHTKKYLKQVRTPNPANLDRNNPNKVQTLVPAKLSHLTSMVERLSVEERNRLVLELAATDLNLFL